MTCDWVRDALDRYLAGTLEAGERAAVAAHLGECDECRADVEAARFLAGPTAGLRREIAPSSDLWGGIASRLHARSRRLSIPVWWLAAAAVLLIGASSAITVAILREPVRDAGFATTEARYQQAAVELNDVYARVRDSLAPETRAILERNLAVIERALGEARAALEADPANRLLEAIVVAAWRRKIDFLERAATIDREG